MVAVQLASARIGRVTGKGLAENLKTFMPRWLLIGLVGLLFIANTINIGADLAAMGEASALVAGGGRHGFTIGFAILSLALQIYVPYHRYAAILKWLTMVLLAYVAVLFMVHVDWVAVINDLVVPHIESRAAITMIVALFGTTISPYLFFWQAAQETEELDRVEERKPLKQAKDQASDALRRIRWDTFVGMAASNIIALAIMLATAATLHANGKTDIQSAADAAKALQPIAGVFAFGIFSLAIVGTGLLAVPVLSGSSSYAICALGGWQASLERKPFDAKIFYAVIALGMALGLAIDWSHINPMKALLWSAVLNGVVAVPVLVGLMLAVSDGQIMSIFAASRSLKIFGWLAMSTMAVAAAAMLF